MAPLTRGRATSEHVPTELMRTYYAQRAGAGLILTEATGISRQGLGWPYAPGIWSGEQVEAWKPVTEAVHEAGGRIFCQLWHMGRLVHPSFLDGDQPVSASATTAPHKAHTYDGRQPYAEARSLRLDEIAGVVGRLCRRGAQRLVGGLRRRADPRRQRLSDRPIPARRHQPSRRRIWRPGRESPAAAAGGDAKRWRTWPGRAAPRSASRPTARSRAATTATRRPCFRRRPRCWREIGIAFLELREPTPEGTFGKAELAADRARHPQACFPGPLVLNSDYGFERAQATLDEGVADAITFGRLYHRQSRPGRALRDGRAGRRRRPGDLVQPGRGGLYRLSAHRGAGGLKSGVSRSAASARASPAPPWPPRRPCPCRRGGRGRGPGPRSRR